MTTRAGSLDDHSRCCHAAPVPNGDLKVKANFGHPKLKPNAYGLYASVGQHHGQRRTMEDRHRVEYGRGARGFFGVFDGHGGSEAAQIASQSTSTAVRYYIDEDVDKKSFLTPPGTPDLTTTVIEHKLSTEGRRRTMVRGGDSFKAEVERAFLRVEDIVLARARQDNFRDGTTASCAWVLGDSVYCGNVGDSRTVLCRAGKAVDLSKDHKPGDEDEKRRIIMAGGTVHPVIAERPGMCCFKAKKVPVGADRLWPGGFSVSRAIGDIDYKDASRGKKVNRALVCKADVTITPLTNEDQFLILATDGIWDVFSSEQAVDYVLKDIKSRSFDPELTASKIVNKAFQMGADDNLTCIVVFFTHQTTWTFDQYIMPQP